MSIENARDELTSIVLSQHHNLFDEVEVKLNLIELIESNLYVHSISFD